MNLVESHIFVKFMQYSSGKTENGEIEMQKGSKKIELKCKTKTTIKIKHSNGINIGG